MKNLVILMAAIVLFASCGKDGAPGAQGPPGNANVNSYVYDVNSWVTTVSPPYECYTDLSVPEITGSVISGGTVQVFEGNASSGSSIWYAMPYSFQGTEVSFDISIGGVRIYRTYDSGNPITPPSVIVEYKVVVIPPV
jgi:hypothetical protein